jgi:hypothetical protein
VLAKTIASPWQPKPDNKAIQSLMDISLNTLWVFLRNHHKNGVGSSKAQAF